MKLFYYDPAPNMVVHHFGRAFVQADTAEDAVRAVQAACADLERERGDPCVIDKLSAKNFREVPPGVAILLL